LLHFVLLMICSLHLVTVLNGIVKRVMSRPAPFRSVCLIAAEVLEHGRELSSLLLLSQPGKLCLRHHLLNVFVLKHKFV
jgi:hypothetical protein